MGRRREPALIFVHVPKAAGTTLREMIRAEYPRVLEIPTVKAYKPMLAELSDSDLDRFDAFMGHMPFGLHERLGRPAAYVTLLRDPVTRSLSAYSYLRRSTDHELHHEVAKLSFEEFIERPPDPSAGRPGANPQTWLLAGGRTADIPLAISSAPELLERARANLDTFAVVGTQEAFEASVGLMAARFGWSSAPPGRLNASATLPTISDATRRRVVERNALDVELHEYATQRLARDLRRRRLHTAAYVTRQRSGPAIAGFTRRLRRRAGRLRRRVARSRS